nr:hypothetical protein [Psychrobacillus sp. INOP01]
MFSFWMNNGICLAKKIWWFFGASSMIVFWDGNTSACIMGSSMLGNSVLIPSQFRSSWVSGQAYDFSSMLSIIRTSWFGSFLNRRVPVMFFISIINM